MPPAPVTVEIKTGLVDERSGNFPAAEKRVGQVVALVEERQLVDVVGVEHLAAIQRPSPCRTSGSRVADGQ
jgi:hypothetical protein